MAGRRMPAALRREQLLDFALDIVAVEGFSALSIERLAREAALTRTAIYHQFGSLDAIIDALVERESRRALAGQSAIVVPACGGVAEIVAYIVATMLDTAAAAPSTWQVLLNPPEGGPPQLHARIAAGRASARAMLDAILRERVFCEADPPEDLELTVHLLHALGEELTRLHLRDPAQYPKHRLVRQAASFARTLSHTEERSPWPT